MAKRGPKPALTKSEAKRVRALYRWQSGRKNMTMPRLAVMFGVSTGTIFRAIHEIEGSRNAENT